MPHRVPEPAAASQSASLRDAPDAAVLFAGRSFSYRGAGKRMLDIAVVLASLPVTLPIIVLLALLVMIEGGKPFFGHRRVGRNGRVFRCWKLRTMVPDAEACLRAHLAGNPEARREWESVFKLSRDPRVTPFGTFLRRVSLDELPQLWNILKGDMSLVGPRPVTRAELKRYGRNVRYYYAMRPGLTGMWQVSGRNAVSYEQRVALDAAYALSCSLLTDLRILLATAKAVAEPNGR